MDLASVHRVARSNTPVSSRATRAAGRNEELDALRRAYRAACDGELRLLVLEGPGKDALLDAWLSEHRAEKTESSSSESVRLGAGVYLIQDETKGNSP